MHFRVLLRMAASALVRGSGLRVGKDADLTGFGDCGGAKVNVELAACN